jgi:hypothetical protein
VSGGTDSEESDIPSSKERRRPQNLTFEVAFSNRYPFGRRGDVFTSTAVRLERCVVMTAIGRVRFRDLVDADLRKRIESLVDVYFAAICTIRLQAAQSILPVDAS